MSLVIVYIYIFFLEFVKTDQIENIVPSFVLKRLFLLVLRILRWVSDLGQLRDAIYRKLEPKNVKAKSFTHLDFDANCNSALYGHK